MATIETSILEIISFILFTGLIVSIIMGMSGLKRYVDNPWGESLSTVVVRIIVPAMGLIFPFGQIFADSYSKEFFFAEIIGMSIFFMLSCFINTLCSINYNSVDASPRSKLAVGKSSSSITSKFKPEEKVYLKEEKDPELGSGPFIIKKKDLKNEAEWIYELSMQEGNFWSEEQLLSCDEWKNLEKKKEDLKEKLKIKVA